MAKATKCAICKYCNWKEMNCKNHPEGIPKDIFLEEVECKDYKVKVVEGEDDLPLVSGR